MIHMLTGAEASSNDHMDTDSSAGDADTESEDYSGMITTNFDSKCSMDYR